MSVQITLNKGRVRHVRTDIVGTDISIGDKFRDELVTETELFSEKVFKPQDCIDMHMLACKIWNTLSYSYEEPYCSRSVLVLGTLPEDLEYSLELLEGCEGAERIAYALKLAIETVKAQPDGTMHYIVIDNNDN